MHLNFDVPDFARLGKLNFELMRVKGRCNDFNVASWGLTPGVGNWMHLERERIVLCCLDDIRLYRASLHQSHDRSQKQTLALIFDVRLSCKLCTF
jgi:hypothetical protein